jgi:large subunit ribosomal protein L16
MLIPSSRKFKKEFKFKKGRIPNITYSGAFLDRGDIGLKAMESGRITSAQIESARKVFSRYLKKSGMKTFIRIFPYKPISKKPAEVRMGGGKGSVEYWVAVIEPGRMLFEISGENAMNNENVQKALEMARYKLPIQTKIVRRLI